MIVLETSNTNNAVPSVQSVPIVRMSLFASSEIALTAQGRMGDNEQKARAMVQDAEKKLASKPGFLSGIFG